MEGRFLASAGSDNKIMLWDLAHGHLLAELSGHTSTIHTLCFSRDGNLLTSGTLFIFILFSSNFFKIILRKIYIP